LIRRIQRFKTEIDIIAYSDNKKAEACIYPNGNIYVKKIEIQSTLGIIVNIMKEEMYQRDIFETE